MKGLPVLLGIALAVSLLFNVVAFVRLADHEVPPPIPARASVAADHPRLDPPRGGTALEEILTAKEPETPAPESPAAPRVGPKPAAQGPALTQPSLRNDPKVREVLQANEAYGAFWKDIDRLSKVRGKFEESKYQQSVMTATVEFLELGDPNRAQFEEAARMSANSYAQAKKDFDAAKAALPPKDKSNPAALATHEQQKDALELRYDTQVKAAVDSLKPYLSAANARHQEFLSNADKWLRTLAPKPAKP